MFEKYLAGIGFSEKEIKVYISALELGEASVLQIAKKSRINRTTTYPILSALKDKGLVSVINKGKKQLFFAESPEKISIFVDARIRELESHKSDLPELVKELKVFENRRQNKPIVRFYEGDEGINTMLEEFVPEGEKVVDPDNGQNKMYISYSRDMQENSVSEKRRDYRRQIRNKTGVKSVYLYTKDKGELISDTLRQRIKVDKKHYPFPAHIAVFKDRIRLISYTKNMGILIFDAEIAETLRSLMRLAVKGAEK